MTILDTNPACVSLRHERITTLVSEGNWITGWLDHVWYRDQEEKTYEWACDNATEDESDHEATYGTGGWVLISSGKTIARGRKTGVWFETYAQYGTWVRDE